MFKMEEVADFRAYCSYASVSEKDRSTIRNSVMEFHEQNISDNRPDLWLYTARRIIAMMQYDIDRAEVKMKGDTTNGKELF